MEDWIPLVHVCHRWRSIIFASPRRLNLQLFCEAGTHARDTLDVWPPLPLLIEETRSPCPGIDNIVAVLERSDRVHQIILTVSNSDLEKVLPAMLVPFPELTDLQFGSSYISTPVPQLPDLFLGGSAPRLQLFSLNRILFPGLPKLLLSAPHLAHLTLRDIPYSGFMSPEAVATVLSTLTSLEVFNLEFQFRSRFHQASRPSSSPPTRFVLHALTSFWFKGVSEYSEDVLARIDAPRLDCLSVVFDKIEFDTSQFIGFISRTPILKAPKEARLNFWHDAVMVTLSPRISGFSELSVKISCRDWDWPPSFLVQICTSYLPPLSTLEDLDIDCYPPRWIDDIENSEWLEALHPFSAAKNLHLSEELAQRIVPALQEPVEGRTTVVLPTLQKIIFKGPKPSSSVRKVVEQFVAARQFKAVSSLPISVIYRPS